MATLTVSKAAGRYTGANYLSHPEGGLKQATNVVIRPTGVIEPRFGIQSYGSGALGGYTAAKLGFYGNQTLVYTTGSTLYLGSSGVYSSVGSFTDPPSTGGVSYPSFVEAAQNLYFNTGTGVYYLTSKFSTTNAKAGVPQALDPRNVFAAAGTGPGDNARIGYRVVWGLKDANNNTKLGPPSGRVVVTNYSGSGTQTYAFSVAIPSGITTSHYYKLYRTVESASDTSDPGDECFLCYVGQPTAGEIAAGTLNIVDKLPSSLLGEPLYTNPRTGEGILSANYPPPVCSDMAWWNERMWFSNTTLKHRLEFTLIGCGAPDGLQDGDTITLAGTTYRAKAAPALATDFALTTGLATPALNIEATAKAFVNLVNSYSGNTAVYGYYTSTEDEAPGKLMFEARALGASSFTVSVSRSTAWQLVTTTSDNSSLPNGLYYSKAGEPEAVPLTNYLTVGPKNRYILRILPLRDKLFVFKEEGVYVVSGSGNYRVDLLDGTVWLPSRAVQSPAVLNNAIYAYTYQGVIRVTESGAEIISVPVQDAFATTAANISDFYGAGYESEHLYVLWMTSSGYLVFNALNNAWSTWTSSVTRAPAYDRQSGLLFGGADQIYYYADSSNTGTGANNYDSTVSVNIVATGTNSLLLSSTAGLSAGAYIERGAAGAVIDSINGAFVNLRANSVYGTFTTGAATAYLPITCTVEFLPQVCGAPGDLKQFRDVTFHFGNGNISGFSGTFITDLDTSTTTTTATLASHAYTSPAAGNTVGYSEPFNRKLFVPLEKQRGGSARFGVSISEAKSTWSLSGYTLHFDVDSDANTRY